MGKVLPKRDVEGTAQAEACSESEKGGLEESSLLGSRNLGDETGVKAAR
jgi:hypothetical protein